MAEALRDLSLRPLGITSTLAWIWASRGPPYANAGCCPIIIIIAVTDDSSNARTTGTTKGMYLFITRIGVRIE